MRVFELMEALSKYPSGAEVFVADGDEVTYVDSTQTKGDKLPTVYINTGSV